MDVLAGKIKNTMKTKMNSVEHPWSVLARGGSGGLAAGVAVLTSVLLSPCSQAILLYGTSDIAANTSAPAGSLTDSGWQFQGTWGSFLGTPIAPNYFVTAEHVGGAVGNKFTYGGNQYTTTASFADPNSDLCIWQVSTAFPTYAPLYTRSDEVGKGLVVMGRGPTRSDTVVYNDITEAGGWTTGGGSGTVRWGENTVKSTPSLTGGLGSMLRADFDRGGGANEAMLGGGDSGGAVFINDGGTWKLAGINYGIIGPFNTSPTDTGSFSGALYDRGGLYQKSGGSWGYVFNNATDLPAYWYATRISSNLPFIESVAGVPEPQAWALGTGAALVGFAALRRLGRKQTQTK